MMVKEYALDDMGSPDAAPGSHPWSTWVTKQIYITLTDKQSKDARLSSLVGLFKEHSGWQVLGFESWELYCKAKLKKSSEAIEEAITARRITQVRAMEPKALNQNGVKTSARGNDYNTFESSTPSIRGDSPEYLTARIARDRPDILERMQAGEFKSARAAAIEAGIIDPVKSKRFSLPADAVQAARYLKQRVNPEWVRDFVKEIEG